MGWMAMFEELKLWVDPVVRPGPEAMAVDEWCLKRELGTLLRVYRWEENWGSLGYFGKLAEAEASFPGLQWVRRWTGGGTVDHRADWTYSLFIPPGEAAFRLKGAESYRQVHLAVAAALRELGVFAALSEGDQETGATACFENPVCYDLIDANSAKLAGAGQRRTKAGLLHQGSVGLRWENQDDFTKVAERLAGQLSTVWSKVLIKPDETEIEEFCRERYRDKNWLRKR